MCRRSNGLVRGEHKEVLTVSKRIRRSSIMMKSLLLSLGVTKSSAFGSCACIELLQFELVYPYNLTLVPLYSQSNEWQLYIKV